MLAKRYLNPRRAVLSSFTLISLIGVLLGVLVLVVVMAVYAGLEREVKGRLLGFTPHILVRSIPASPVQEGEEQVPAWQKLASKISDVKGVVASTAFISDNVILDVGSWQRPVAFRGIDTSDKQQVRGIREMLDLKNFPQSSADMGLDDRAVVSSIVAEQFGLNIGDKMRLYSTRNFESVMDAYKVTESPVVREAFPDVWAEVSAVLTGKWKKTGKTYQITVDAFQKTYDNLIGIYRENIREPERELLYELLNAMEAGQREPEEVVYHFQESDKAKIDKAFEGLSKTDTAELDGQILKGIKSLVLPKEVEVIGIYSASQMAMTPDIFVPLPLAQDLAGLGDEVQGVALRLDDPYQAEQIAIEVRQRMVEGNMVETWGDQFKPFFRLINQQRMMMYFALSFIVLISAFSMMAVMFTVTIQKRREIGVMKSLGAAPGQIVRVFLYQGMLLGVLGALLGIGLGRLVIHFRGALQEGLRALKFDPFSESLTGFAVLPAYNNAWEQAVIGLMAFVLCSLAALVPAFFAARSDAAKSLRNL